MDFSPEQDWKKILTPLGAFIKPFLFQNWTLKKKKNGTSDTIQFLFIPLHRMGLWSPIPVAFMSMLNHY